MEQIRAATKDDIYQCAALLQILFSQESEFIPNIEKQINGLNMIISDINRGIIFVYEKNNYIIGMVSLIFTVSTALGTNTAILEDMVISPDARGYGIGSKLINFATNYAKENRISRITLLTDNDNFTAHSFYRKHNFIKSNMLVFRKYI